LPAKTADFHLSEIIKKEKTIEAATKDISILFADLVGSTHYKATKGFAEGLKRTYIHNQCVSIIVAENKGSVIKFIGDEVMATFESPDNALQAGIMINKTLNSLNVKPAIDTKIGIHKGEVSFFKYPNLSILDPQGTSVDLAARIVSVARGRQILFTDAVKDALKYNFKIANTVQFTPKGIPYPVTVHALEFHGCEIQIDKPNYIPYLDESTLNILDVAREALSKRDYHNSFKYALQVLAKDPKHPEACYIVGASTATGEIMDIDRGIKALEYVLSAKYNHYRAMYMLGYLLWSKYEKNNDICLINRAIEWTRNCLDLCRTAEYEDKLLEFKSQQNLAYFLAIIEGEENIDEALHQCSNADKFYSQLVTDGYARFLDTYGFVLMKMGKHDEAKAKFKEALKLNEENKYIHRHMYELIQIIEDKKKALRRSQK
jgi:class 3 adenylate cyclase